MQSNQRKNSVTARVEWERLVDMDMEEGTNHRAFGSNEFHFRTSYVPNELRLQGQTPTNGREETKNEAQSCAPTAYDYYSWVLQKKKANSRK